MRSLFLPMVGAGFALALPAVAQTSTPSSPAVATSKPSGTANPNSPMTRQKMESDLKQAGFTDIRVVPESFLISGDEQGWASGDDDDHPGFVHRNNPHRLLGNDGKIRQLDEPGAEWYDNAQVIISCSARDVGPGASLLFCARYPRQHSGNDTPRGSAIVAATAGVDAAFRAKLIPSGWIPRHQFATLCAGTMTRYGGRSARLPARREPVPSNVI